MSEAKEFSGKKILPNVDGLVGVNGRIDECKAVGVFYGGRLQ